MATKLYFALKDKIIRRKETRRDTKLKIYRAVYRPVLTFGCESWVMTQRQRSKVRAAEMRYLRGVYGVNIMDKINSQKICDELQVQRVEDFIKQRQFGW